LYARRTLILISDATTEFEIDPGDPIVVTPTSEATTARPDGGRPGGAVAVGADPETGPGVALAVVTSEGETPDTPAADTVALASADGAGDLPTVGGGFERDVGDLTVVVPEGGETEPADGPHLPVVLVEGDGSCAVFVDAETRAGRERTRDPNGRVARRAVERRGWDPTDERVSLHGPSFAALGKAPSLADHLRGRSDGADGAARSDASYARD